MLYVIALYRIMFHYIVFYYTRLFYNMLYYVLLCNNYYPKDPGMLSRMPLVSQGCPQTLLMTGFD